MNEHEKAKAVLSLPREKYAAMDGAEPQTALLAEWDRLAEKYPELAEATLYFSGKTSLDCLALRFVEQNGDMLWLDLKTTGEPRQCCYQLNDGIWEWVAGDSEPPMSAKLQSAWENGRGDAAINACRETGNTQFLRA
jgi:hypothetical protein